MRNYDLAEKHLEYTDDLARRVKCNVASQEYEKVIPLLNGYARAQTVFGLALLPAGRYQEAVEQFLKVVESDPTFPLDVGELRIALYHDIRQIEDIRQFQKVVDVHDHAELYFC